jgi:hypothetical protein
MGQSQQMQNPFQQTAQNQVSFGQSPYAPSDPSFSTTTQQDMMGNRSSSPMGLGQVMQGLRGGFGGQQQGAMGMGGMGGMGDTGMNMAMPSGVSSTAGPNEAGMRQALGMPSTPSGFGGQKQFNPYQQPQGGFDYRQYQQEQQMNQIRNQYQQQQQQQMQQRPQQMYNPYQQQQMQQQFNPYQQQQRPQQQGIQQLLSSMLSRYGNQQQNRMPTYQSRAAQYRPDMSQAQASLNRTATTANAQTASQAPTENPFTSSFPSNNDRGD